MKLSQRFLGFLFGLSLAASTQAAVKGEEIQYQVDGQEFTGYLAYDDALKGKRPGILVVHEWWGHNDYARHRAELLAAEGYTALALDMYGSGKLAQHPDDAQKFMQAVLSQHNQVKQRFDKAWQLLAQHDSVKPQQIAAIGYCFGGGVVLNMARAGADLAAVVSFHGSIGTDNPAKAGDIHAKVLVFNGAADPFVTPEQVAAFKQEMETAQADYRFVSYPGVKHSFTNPAADDFAQRFDMPLAYDAKADKDSWQQTLATFKQLFAKP